MDIKASKDYIIVSQSLLYSVRIGDKAILEHMQELREADESVLFNQLQNDDQRKAFWLNIYNAYVQWSLQRNPERYGNRNIFFASKQIRIAGRELSLDDVEHGILRRSKIKWSFGYLTDLFPGHFEKRFRVDAVDYRIHFALNCGAVSCPPIAFYTSEKLNVQLDMAAKNYLANEAEYNKEKNRVSLPAIMSWYRADFKGRTGMKRLLKEHGIIPGDANPSIRFKPYDWNIFLHNYKTGNE